ncbi:MAG TPA: hypothetical protein VGM68_11225 [Rhizomicrobium sp.]
MFDGFDAALLSSSDFKEDSVREIIITPILTRLGYMPSGENRVMRSKSLVHPYIYVGTRQLPVTLIPDYTLIAADKPLCILDAKSPTENILAPKNVGQAYSYAIHPEIKCSTFSLCNGKQLAVFDTSESKPSLVVNFDEFESNWEVIEKHLGPRFLKNPTLRKFAPDLGFAMSRLGIGRETKIVMLSVQLNLFARLDDSLMTATANCGFADQPHCATFDFAASMLMEILAGLPEPLAKAFRGALFRAPFMAAAELAIELDLELHLGPETQGQTEKFMPLIIDKVIAARFNHLPLPPEKVAKDIPDHVFQLRKAYKIRS